ncbi:DUF819 family protein [Pseudomaricurvus alkylphenolicus]|uniref:DUF819 family protein n=1 Tax=Pseudomaricurvus alkylphenolicus TaxID=1306991 RepID=UPI00142025F2|nr:DUF819 family protein [Pseudomaricurvus alkylphenolicus]NIB40427.1 DUF819 family protein [Pseudomaricurvus alkylphenolicus]
MSLVPADNVLAVCTVVFGLAWLGFWIDTLSIGRKISGVVWVLCGAMLLSNFQVIPFKSQVYDFVGGVLVPLAIPLLLFKSDMRRIFKESGKVMLIFCLASAATVTGAVLGFYLFDLGEIGPKVAGVYSGGYIGGAVNFLAVSQVVEMSTDEFSTAISASSIVSILALMILLAIPSIKWITRQFQSAYAITEDGVENKVALKSKVTSFRLTHLSGALTLSFLICTVSKFVAAKTGFEQYTFLIITALTLLIANLFPKLMNRIEGEFDTGLLLMYLFFAVVGAGTDMSAFLGAAIVLFFYGSFIIVIHLVVTFALARTFKFGLEETVVASGAALVGPAVTAAIATSRNWRELVTPGIMCGIFGYAIATFIGVSISGMLG